MNRELWLTELSAQVQPLFKMELQPYRLTCGWPSSRGLASTGRVLGECYGVKSSVAGIHEIFISPTMDSPLQVAGVTVHEMTHVAAGVDAQHKGKFVQMCRHVGLTEGKPTSAMPGERLNNQLRRIIEKLGEYPHQAVVPVMKTVKPSTDMTLTCKECGCKVRLSNKWFQSSGPPTCGCGGEMD